MTALLAARGQHLTAPHALHAGAEAMGLMAPAHFGLKRAFRQRMLLIAGPKLSLNTIGDRTLTGFSQQHSERLSLCDALTTIKPPQGYADRDGKKGPPLSECVGDLDATKGVWDQRQMLHRSKAFDYCSSVRFLDFGRWHTCHRLPNRAELI